MQAPEREVVIPLTRSNENGASDADYSGVPAERHLLGDPDLQDLHLHGGGR